MKLTPRQLETIENLKIKGIITPDEIIKYCNEKLLTSRFKGKQRRRRHSKEYYRELINYFEDIKNKKTPIKESLS